MLQTSVNVSLQYHLLWEVLLGIQVLVVLIELLSVVVKFLVRKQTKRSYWVFHCLLVVIARGVIGSYGWVIRHFYYQTDQFGFSISSTATKSSSQNGFCLFGSGQFLSTSVCCLFRLYLGLKKRAIWINSKKARETEYWASFGPKKPIANPREQPKAPNQKSDKNQIRQHKSQDK